MGGCVLLLWASVSWANEGTIQRIHELVWQDADALNLAAQIPGADARTRGEAARGLGRLQTSQALILLEDLRQDSDLGVQIRVAEALGWVPGGNQVIRTWLAELGSLGSSRAGPATERYAALVQALGAAGEKDDVGAMVAALREPWPVASVAAGGLATMASREVPAVQTAVPTLISRLRGPDPRVVADAARALAVIGLHGQATPADIQFVQDRLRRGTTPQVQADLLKVVWPALEPADRAALFLQAATDTARSLRVAALVALQPGDVPADVVSTFLADPDPWVRHGALAALARDPSPEATDALRRHADEAGDYEAAAALDALGLTDDGRAIDTREPDPVRAALVPRINREGTLVRLALEDAAALVRTSAAKELMNRGTSRQVGEALLDADDPVVRWFGVRLVGQSGRRAVPTLLAYVGGEEHHLPQTEALRLLLPYAARLDKGTSLRRALLRAASSVSPALRQAGDALRRATGLSTVGSSRIPGAQIQEARRIRGARVTTTRGNFRIALEPEVAPLAVANFASLAEDGFFSSLTFSEVVPGQHAVTGCPRNDGYGDAGYVAPAELSSTSFRRGTVAMMTHPLGGVGSRWMVATSDLVDRRGPHTRLGHVVEGQAVVDRLEAGDQVLSVTIERLPE